MQATIVFLIALALPGTQPADAPEPAAVLVQAAVDVPPAEVQQGEPELAGYPRVVRDRSRLTKIRANIDCLRYCAGFHSQCDPWGQGGGCASTILFASCMQFSGPPPCFCADC